MEHFVKDGPLQNGLLSFSALVPLILFYFLKDVMPENKTPRHFWFTRSRLGHLKYIDLTSAQRDIEKKLLVFYSISEKVFFMLKDPGSL